MPENYERNLEQREQEEANETQSEESKWMIDRIKSFFWRQEDKTERPDPEVLWNWMARDSAEKAQSRNEKLAQVWEEMNR